ncbi:MAG: hypothetical protein QXI58_00940 [Candidatus Micrarchaeia archaeon]
MNILVYDNNIGFCFALKFILEQNKVYYFIDKWDPFPELADWSVGQGINNLIKIYDLYEGLNKADLIFFTDIGKGKTIDYLKKKGYLVFGAPKAAEELEFKKAKFYTFLKANNLPVVETFFIKGIDNAISFFKKYKGRWYLKIDMPFRGSLSTTLINDFDEAEVILNTIKSKIIPLGDQIQFVIQRKIDGYYIGFDSFVFHGNFYPEILFGFEIDHNTVSKWCLYQDTIFFKPISIFSKFFQEIDYSGLFSLEGIFDGSKLYLVDPACRPAYPTPAPMICQNVMNFTEFIFNNLTNKKMKLEYKSEYVSGFEVRSTFSDFLLNVVIKKSAKFWPRRLFIKDNSLYIAPTAEKNKLIGVLVGEGKNYEETFSDVEKQSDYISCYGIEFIFNFDDFRTHIKSLKNLGILF